LGSELGQMDQRHRALQPLDRRCEAHTPLGGVDAAVAIDVARGHDRIHLVRVWARLRVGRPPGEGLG
jgi:hypothetical protein